MNIHEFINEYFGSEATCRFSGLGLSNDNYYVDYKDSSYMVRIPNPRTTDLKNRCTEKQALQITKDCSFSLTPLYFNSETGILVTELINPVATFSECSLNNKITLVANALKEMHSLGKLTQEYFDPLQKYESFAKNIKEPLFDTTPYLSVLENLPQPTSFTLCHNDLVNGNLLFHNSKLYIIDFEYASNNDPLFDIMSFFSENQIMDPQQREEFYQAYFTDKKVPYEDLERWENYQNLLWCTWAMMMWELHHNEEYKEIATWKFEYLKK